MDLRCFALTVGLSLAGCNASGPAPVPARPLGPAPVPARPPGLIQLAQALQTTPSPHLTEALVLGDYVYVGNSNDQVAVYELQAEGGLELLLGWTGPTSEGLRCTSLAAHEPSRSLYCASDDSIAVVRFDLSDPARPVRDPELFNPSMDKLHISAMAVAGDQLVFAAYDRGLATAQIDDAGRLAGFVEQPELGQLRRVAVDGAGRLWALTNDRGLLVLEPDGDRAGAWVERWQLGASELDGPALGLGVDGSRAAIGLGSAGLAIVQLDPQDPKGLRRTHLLRPPGVVTAADLRGDAAVAVTLLGVFAYDLREPERWPEDPRGEQPREAFDEGGARLAGFVPGGPWDRPGGGGAMLDGALFEGEGSLELIISDWTWVGRLALDLDGFPAAIDVRHGEWVPVEDQTVAIAVRNPTPFRVPVELQLVGSDDWFEAELEPRATATIALPADRFEIDVAQLVFIRAYDGDEIVDLQSITVIRRPPLEGWPVHSYGRPPRGASFPSLTVASGWVDAIEPRIVPNPGVEQRIVFYGTDCAAMWPELEDLLWRVRSGELEPEAVVLLTHSDPTTAGAYDRWGLGEVTWGYYDGPTFPPELRADNPFADLYDGGFVLQQLPSAAHHPTDYVVGADGRVVLVEREYRGVFELPGR